MKYYKATIWKGNDGMSAVTEAFAELGQAMIYVHKRGDDMLWDCKEPQEYRWRIDNEDPFVQSGDFEVAIGRFDDLGNVIIISMRTK